MKRNYIFFQFTGLLLILFIGLSSCEGDFLEIKPKGQMIPETTSDYRKLLDMIVESNVGTEVTTLRTTGIVNYLDDNFQLADSANYNLIFPSDAWAMYNWAAEGALVDIDREDVDWRALYGGIYVMNQVIHSIDGAKGSQTEKDQLAAEAKFHRAFNFLHLVNLYAKHYSANAATDLGVPLRLDLSLTSNLERNTVQKVYDQIIKDITEAIPNLPAQPMYKHRPSKVSAYALLARTYLFMGEYAKSLENANLALAISDFLYDYKSKINENYVMGINAWYDDEMLIMKTTTSRTSRGFTYHHTYLFSTVDIVSSVFDTINDLRFHNKFSRTLNSPNRFNYAEGARRWNGGFMYFPHIGLTTPEVLLTAAECEARIGDIAKAMQIVNRIRLNRYKEDTHVDLAAANRPQAIEYVLAERRKELWARGIRWYDLRRLNAIEGANISIQRSFTTHSLAPGDRGWVMPIARMYIDLNKEIQQNPGY